MVRIKLFSYFNPTSPVTVNNINIFRKKKSSSVFFLTLLKEKNQDHLASLTFSSFLCEFGYKILLLRFITLAPPLLQPVVSQPTGLSELQRFLPPLQFLHVLICLMSRFSHLIIFVCVCALELLHRKYVTCEISNFQVSLAANAGRSISSPFLASVPTLDLHQNLLPSLFPSLPLVSTSFSTQPVNCQSTSSAIISLQKTFSLYTWPLDFNFQQCYFLFAEISSKSSHFLVGQGGRYHGWACTNMIFSIHS